MSWLSDWFRRDSTQKFIAIIVKAAAVFLGKVTGDLYDLTKRAVNEAESHGGTGIQKYNYAWKLIKQEIGDRDDITKYLIKIFIEAAVIEIKKANNQL